ncbi:PREDICTED: periphilin-1 isoform X5 [Poecilia mexicana]|uniref:Periphilin 1 n=1 Tax=Poecilia formosa TaxID=48698 RepID=A0A087YC69_POEFO|nr:PREDICTED: periphilin-1 isoform X5 [Poecilia formosa]XP_014826138.1 PREDICTED: periphilin-1 isoform X5 [Poecilia mexicana]
MTYRRDRSIREVYEDRFMQERPGTYPRAAGAVERRGPFGRPEDEYGRGGYEYEGGPRFYPNGGGPRGFHDDQRGYPVEGHHFPERRAIPPARREDFPYRVPREDPHAGRSLEFGARVPPPPSVRSQGVYPAARSLPESGEDTLVQAIRNLDRGEDRDPYRRKAALFPPLRERSPVRREVARSPHSRSGSSVSSRGYSPDRAKNLPFSTQQGKRYEETYTESKIIDKIPGLSREGSPQSATSNKEESNPPEAEKEEPIVTPVTEDSKKSTENLEERRTMAIAAKAKEIEKVYRQDCETFGMVVKMLVAKDPSLEKQLQVPLRENLGEIRERCLEDLKHFIKELDEDVRLPEPSVCDSVTPAMSQKLLKTGVNHSSSSF